MIEIPRRVQLQSFQFQFNLANECLGQYDSRCQEFGCPKKHLAFSSSWRDRGRRVEMFMTDLGIMFGRVMLQGLMFPPHLHKQLSILHVEVVCSVNEIRCSRKRGRVSPQRLQQTQERAKQNLGIPSCIKLKLLSNLHAVLTFQFSHTVADATIDQ